MWRVLLVGRRMLLALGVGAAKYPKIQESGTTVWPRMPIVTHWENDLHNNDHSNDKGFVHIFKEKGVFDSDTT